VKLNLAILLTLFRIAAIPAVVVLFYSNVDNARPIAAILFGIAAVTDFLDGWVARKYGQGDPDWHVDIIAMIIIGREITVSALREWMATIGERANVKVSWTGKLKTVLQMFGIGFMVFQNEFMGLDIYSIGFALLVVAAVMTIWSMIIYLRAAWPYIAERDSAG
jgi:CDP-diacylglycerol--glycerol-3-phosphate 3-phosphatidyltransferase/cardiolipin synthase